MGSRSAVIVVVGSGVHLRVLIIFIIANKNGTGFRSLTD